MHYSSVITWPRLGSPSWKLLGVLLGLLALSAHSASYADLHDNDVLDGWTIQGGRGWSESGGYVLPEDGSSKRGFLLHDAIASPDGDFEARLACGGGEGSTLCRYGGLVFRYTDSSHFYAVFLQESNVNGAAPGNVLYMLKDTSNTGVAVGPNKVVVASNLDLSGFSREYPIKISMEGPTLTFYLNNVQIGQITDADNNSGAVGYFYDSQWSRYTSFASSQWTEKTGIQNKFPADGAIHVPTGRQPLRLQFSEPMQKGVGNIVLKDASNNVVETIDVTSSQVAIDDAALRHGFETDIEEWTWGAGTTRTQSAEQAHSGTGSLKVVTSGTYQSAEAFYSGEWNNISGSYDWSAFDSVIVWVYTDQASTDLSPFVRSGDIAAPIQTNPAFCALTQSAWTRCAYPLDLAQNSSRIFSFGLFIPTVGTYYVDDVGLKKTGSSYVTIVPSASLVLDEAYHVEMDAGALQTQTAVPYGGITNATAWNFYTNRSPTDVALSNAAVLEGLDIGTTVGSLSATDADGVEPFSYTLVAGAGSTDNASFTIDGTTLKTAATFDYPTQASYSIRVQVNDGYYGLYQEQLTIAVSENQTPTDIALSNSSLTENAGANAVVGTLSAADPDTPSTFTYALVAGAGDTDNGLFNINGTSLRATASLDYETKNSYTVRVQVTDHDGATYAEAFVITLNNVNDNAPVFTSAATVTANENGTAVMTVTSSDADAGATVAYGLSGTDAALFSLGAASGVLAFISAPNFEAPGDADLNNYYELTIAAFDGVHTTNQSLTVQVLNVNETPTAIAFTAATLAENAGANAVAGSFATTDPDAGNTFTYTMAAGAGDTDNALFNTNGNSLRATASLDFENRSSYSVRIRSTDQGGLGVERSIVIALTNVNDNAPVLTGGTLTIPQSAAVGWILDTLAATDADGALNALSYSIVAGNDEGHFALQASTGVLSLATALHSTDSVFSLTVRVSDGTNVQETAMMILVSRIPYWNGDSITVEVVDRLAMRVWSRLWALGDTLAIDSGTTVHLRLGLKNADAAEWLVDVLSSQEGLTAEVVDDSIELVWEARETGSQTLSIAWNVVGDGADTLSIPFQVRPATAPVLRCVGISAQFLEQQKVLNYPVGDSLRISSVPDRLVFQFDVQSRNGASVQWKVLQGDADISGFRDGADLTIAWNAPSATDLKLDVVVVSSEGLADTVHIAWRYTTATTATRTSAVASAFQLLRNASGQAIGFHLPEAGRVRVQTVSATGAVIGQDIYDLAAGDHLLPRASSRGTFTRIQWGSNQLVLRP